MTMIASFGFSGSAGDGVGAGYGAGVGVVSCAAAAHEGIPAIATNAQLDISPAHATERWTRRPLRNAISFPPAKEKAPPGVPGEALRTTIP